METIPLSPYKPVVDGIKEAGGGADKFCYECGKCDTVCPWNRVRKFSVRKIINQAKFGVVPFESEDIWLCTTCGNCVQRCPRGVEIIDVMRAMRRVLVPDGVVPTSIPNLRGFMTSIASVGNPWGQEPQDRANWAKDLGVKEFSEGTEVLYFSCCYTSYDPRLKKVAQATADLLTKAGVDFGILGAKEMCCGESVRKAGNETLESRKNSLCCGMGGSRIWMETAKEERFSNLRLEQAREVEAEVLATSCPYCITQFEDSRLTLKDSESIQIKDITEILQEVI